jgi:hypothetical protein
MGGDLREQVLNPGLGDENAAACLQQDVDPLVSGGSCAVSPLQKSEIISKRSFKKRGLGLVSQF